MALAETLDTALRQAIKERDTPTANVLRMLKTRLTERTTGKGFSGQVDDALVVEVIAAYRKQLARAREEYEGMGEAGRAQAEALAFEMAVCDRYLPRRLEADAIRTLVRERLAALGVTDLKQAGRVVGDIMKTHRGQVEAADVKRVAEELLQG
jgi:hypothetical protein